MAKSRGFLSRFSQHSGVLPQQDTSGMQGAQAQGHTVSPGGAHALAPQSPRLDPVSTGATLGVLPVRSPSRSLSPEFSSVSISHTVPTKLPSPFKSKVLYLP